MLKVPRRSESYTQNIQLSDWYLYNINKTIIEHPTFFCSLAIFDVLGDQETRKLAALPSGKGWLGVETENRRLRSYGNRIRRFRGVFQSSTYSSTSLGAKIFRRWKEESHQCQGWAFVKPWNLGSSSHDSHYFESCWVGFGVTKFVGLIGFGFKKYSRGQA